MLSENKKKEFYLGSTLGFMTSPVISLNDTLLSCLLSIYVNTHIFGLSSALVIEGYFCRGKQLMQECMIVLSAKNKKLSVHS